MNRIGKGIASFAAVIIFAGSIGCSSVTGAARDVSQAYIDAILSMDIERADSLCIDGDSGLADYLESDYKIRPVSLILSFTHYRFEAGMSGRGEDGSLEAVYTLVMPNINETLASAPTDYESFAEALRTHGNTDVTVAVSLKKNGGTWYVANSGEIASNLYGSLFYPGYEFVLDGNSVFTDSSWTSSGEDGSFNDVDRISCHYGFTDEFISSGVSLDLTYRYYIGDREIYSGTPVYDEDGNGVSFPLRVDDTSFDLDFLPEYDYRLVVSNMGNTFYEDHHECTLSPSLFPDGTAVDDIVWQYTDISGIYFNCSEIIAKVWLDDAYIESGRDLDITYDIFRDGQIIMSGGQAQIYGNIAICSYSEDTLDTGSYSINVYNNGTFTGGAVASVILNLDPDDYTELELPDNVEDNDDSANASLEICTNSRNAIDIIDDYSEVDFDYEVLSMNTFEDQMDAILASGENAPDVIICDSGCAGRYAMSDVTIPLNNIGISYQELQYMYEYTFAMMTDADSVIKGVSWEITPGAVFYCRSAMDSEFGVSEPGEVAPYFESWDSVLEASRAVNESSGGTRHLISCPSDIENAYIYGRSDSWFDSNGDIDTPEYMQDYLPFINALTNEDLTFNCYRWSTEWNSRISNRSSIAYFGTMRFGELFLRPYHPGDWGIVMPPSNYYDGGNFIFVTKYCDMDASAARLIRNVAISEENLRDMADSGMTVNNISVMMACAGDDTYSESWLNGQNPFRVFTDVAWGINPASISDYDDAVNSVFIQVCDEYVNGGYSTPDEAVEAFESEAQGVTG